MDSFVYVFNTLCSQRSPPPHWAKPLGLVGMIRHARAPAGLGSFGFRVMDSRVGGLKRWDEGR